MIMIHCKQTNGTVRTCPNHRCRYAEVDNGVCLYDEWWMEEKEELDAIAMEAIAPSLTDYVDTDAYTD